MTTIHTASELLVEMRNCGFTIQLDGEMLEVSQAKWIDEELAYLIRTYKDDLITILEKENEG